jgi:hypothetical protein
VVPRWTYTRTKLETADRAKEHLKHTAFSSTRSWALMLPSAIQFSRIYDRRSYKKAIAPVDALAEQCFL